MCWYHSTKTAKIFWVTLDVAMRGAAYIHTYIQSGPQKTVPYIILFKMHCKDDVMISLH